MTGGDFKQVKTTDKNGYIKFDNLPLGRDYELNETKQPNSHYKQMYHTTINNLNGDNPVQMFDLKTVTDINTHKDFYIDKKDVQGNPLKGAQFVIVRNDNPNPNISPEEAKKNGFTKSW